MSWLLIVGLKNAMIVVPLALAAMAAGRCFRRPALAHVLWVLVLIKLLTPPLVDVPVGWSIDVGPWLAEQPRPTNSIQTSPGQSQSPLATSLPLTPSPTGRIDSAPANSRSPSAIPARAVAASLPAPAAGSVIPAWLGLPRTAGGWLAIAGFVWLCGSTLTATLMLRRALRFHRFLRLAARSDHRLAGRVRQLAYAVGLKSSPSVIVVDGVVSPMLWGLGRRVQLVFPARLADRLAQSETDALLLHELAHYARGDYWVRLVELCAHVAFWWHPVVWWARREIESAEELCCDAWVVEHQSGTRLSYAEALLATIDFLCEPATPLPPAACGLGDVPLLRSRLTQIMRGDLGGQLSRTVWISVLGAGIVLSPLEPAVFATSSREIDAVARPARTRLIGRAARNNDQPAPAAPLAADRDIAAATSTAEPVSPPAIALPADAASAEERPLSVVFATAQSPSGRYRLEARTGYETTLLHSGLPQGRLGLSSNRITCATFAPDSRSFVTGHEDGLLRQWDSETGGSLFTFRIHTGKIVSVAYSPAGTHVAAGTSDGTLLVWDLAAQNEVARLANPGIAVSCLRWSPDGSRLAVALGSYTSSDDARLLIWSPSDGQIEAEQSLARPLGALDWLSADALLLAQWSGDATLRVLDSDLPEQQTQLDKNVVSAAHWSPDCRLISAWDAQQLLSGAVR